MKPSCINCNEYIFTRDGRKWCPVIGEWISAKKVAEGKVCAWHPELVRRRKGDE